MFWSVPRIASVTSWSLLGSAVSVGMPSSSSGGGGAASSPPLSEIAATPVRPWNSRPTRVSLRSGVLFSIMASATTRRGLSSFTETTSPTRIPLKLTLPPLRRPAAGPSNTTRKGLRCLVVCSDWNHSTKPIAAAMHSQRERPDQHVICARFHQLLRHLSPSPRERACHGNIASARDAARPACRRSTLPQ